jgi:hypothetical protein
MELCSLDELLKWRSEFPILERTSHKISNSLGACLEKMSATR